MKYFFTILFLFFIFSFTFSQSSYHDDNTAAYQVAIDKLSEKLQKAKDYLANNADNSQLINIQNKMILDKLNKTKDQLRDASKKARGEHNKTKSFVSPSQDDSNEAGNAIADASDQSSHHILFDESTSDTSASNDDSITTDEQNEIVLAEYCTRSFVDLIPPSFCVKKPLDLGSLTVLCADGDHEILGICYSSCSSGYAPDETGLLCVQQCSAGYSVFLDVFCSKGFSVKVRDHYVRTFYTKLDGRAYCKAPKVKFNVVLPLCFKDCNQISLLNCGPYTCAMTKTECNDSIKNIIKDIIIGMGKLFLDVISFGLSGLIISVLTNPNAMYTAAKSAGKVAMLQAYNNVKVWLQRVDQTQLVTQMISLTNGFIAHNSTLAGIFTSDRIANRCQSVKDIFNEKIVNTDQPNDEWKDFNSTDLRAYINACREANAAFSCQQSIRQSVLKWDPTGIVSMISAFKQQDCPTF